ncbi:hypothetical protein Btru_052735 [Bulinus truncatus]|nr:hypothetical protein Btru_052735 [Bulinus truncatus]
MLRTALRATRSVCVLRTVLRATYSECMLRTALRATCSVCVLRTALRATYSGCMLRTALRATCSGCMLRTALRATCSGCMLRTALIATCSGCMLRTALRATCSGCMLRTAIRATCSVCMLRTTLRATRSVCMHRTALRATCSVCVLRTALRATCSACVLRTALRATHYVMFPNFYRVVLPDKPLLRAMAEFIREKGWHYFSIIYDNDDQFQSLREQLASVMPETSVCLDENLKVYEGTDFAEVLTQLTSGRCWSRIVVVLASDYICKIINREVSRMNLNRKLFWFGADTWMQLIFDERAPSGSIGVSYTGTSRPVENYIEHLMGLYGRTRNPWFPSAMRHLNCTDEETYRKMVRSHYHENPALTSLTYSAVYALLQVLKQFLKVHGCSEKNPQVSADCFHAHEGKFSKFFKDLSAHGNPAGSHIYHDDHRGNGRFSFYQLVLEKSKKLLELSHYELAEQAMFHSHEIDGRPFDYTLDYFHPLSFCMPECGFDEHRAYITQCCWRCRKCQDSEIVSESGTYCEGCPRLYWPALAENNKSVCMEIDPDFYTLSHPLCGFLFFLTVVGALFALAVLVWYVLNRDNNLVKASSVELNYVHLVTFLASYMSVPLFLMEPTHTNCTVGVLLFTVSFNISYMIMLMKAVRVYRIFSRSGKAMKVPYISPSFHLVVCFGFLAAEIIRFLVVDHFFPIESALYQPAYNVKYVEKACSIPAFHMLLFVVLDFALLLLCSLFAFKTQTLPSRFKESRFVSTCVLTTLVIWSAFLPAYFTTVYHKTRSLYVVFTILINNNMALFLIFVSRLVLVEYIRGDGALYSVVSYLCFCEKS